MWGILQAHAQGQKLVKEGKTMETDKEILAEQMSVLRALGLHSVVSQMG